MGAMGWLANGELLCDARARPVSVLDTGRRGSVAGGPWASWDVELMANVVSRGLWRVYTLISAGRELCTCCKVVSISDCQWYAHIAQPRSQMGAYIHEIRVAYHAPRRVQPERAHHQPATEDRPQQREANIAQAKSAE